MSESYISYMLQTSSLILISLLLLFHTFRHQYTAKQNKTAQNACRKSESKVFKILNLKYISYLVCIAYIFEALIVIFSGSFIINSMPQLLNNTKCNTIYRISSTMSLIGRFGIHLFVAVRCRFASHRKKMNMWSKIGLTLIVSDLLIIVSIWIYPPQIVSIYNGNCCLIHSYSIIYVVWVILNDIVISIYCLIVFVYPLKKIIQSEKQQNCEKTDLEYFVKRIMFCCAVSLFGILIHCSVASTIGFDSIIAPINSFVTCYMMVMQFRDINPYKVKSKYWRLIIFLFEWDYWCCCNIKKKYQAKTIENNLGEMIQSKEPVMIQQHKKNLNSLEIEHTTNNFGSDSDEGNLEVLDEYNEYINTQPVTIEIESHQRVQENNHQLVENVDHDTLKLDLESKSAPLLNILKLKHAVSKINKSANKLLY